MASLAIGSVTLSYDDAGQGEPIFLLVHGWIADRAVWAPEAENLSRNFRCIAVDLRGCGQSTPIPPFDIATQADDLAGLLRELGTGPVIVAGHGLGGLVALALNLNHPDLVLGVAAADAPLRPGWEESLVAQQVRDGGLRGPVLSAFGDDYGSGMLGGVERYIDEVLLAAPLDVAAGMLEPAPQDRFDLTLALKRADQKPFMAIWPASSPRGDIEWLRRQLVFLRHETVVGGRHFFPLEQPELTSAYLRAFVVDVDHDPRIAAMR